MRQYSKLKTVLEAEASDESTQSSNLEPGQPFQTLGTRAFGKSVFALMLLGGVLSLRMHTKLLQNLDLQSATVVQQKLVDAGFADWQKIALVAGCAFIFAFLAPSSRNRSLPISLPAP